MKPCVFVFVFLHGVSSMTHSLKYFYTASSQVPNFPEFVVVAMVNDVEIDYYDSNIKKAVPKQDWVNDAADPQYWERHTGIYQGTEQAYKANIEIIKERLNQTGGVHIFQQMYGCEWDDETNRVTVNKQFGYDGEDFIVFDLESETWIAPRSEAVITKHQWDKNEAEKAYIKNYLTQECTEWLKKYVQFGKDTLMRTERPSIYLLQKTSTSPVTCHATGFYPDQAMLFWAKDGEEVQVGVDPGEILPNHDGTFQMSVELDMSSVKAEDWGSYSCVFQLSGVKEDIFTKLDKAVIRTNEKSSIHFIIIAVLAALCLLVVAALGFALYKKRNDKLSSNQTKNDSEVMEELNPPKK